MCRLAKLFVAVLGGSSYTFVEPFFGEDLTSWVAGHIAVLEYFGGSAQIWVPDNNPTYAELSRHDGAAVIPARVR